MDENNSTNTFFIHACVVVLESLICGLLFTLFYYGALQGTGTSFDDWTVWVNYKQSLLIVLFSYALCAAANPLVFYHRSIRAFQVLHRVMTNVTFYALLSSFVLTIGGFDRLSIPSRILFWVCLIVVFFFERLLLRSMVRAYRCSARNLKYAVLVGSKDSNLEILKELSDSGSSGYKVLGYFDDEPREDFPEDCPFLGDTQSLIGYLTEHPEVQYLFCCLTSDQGDYIRTLITFCENHLVHFYSVPNVRSYLHHRMTFHMLGTVPYLSLRPEPLRNPFNRMCKRLFDIIVSGTFLITVFPIVWLIVAIITKVTMPGPVFFRQKRNGLNGEEFYCYKFRSMRVNQDADRVQATKDDPRKTRWGQIMRHYNIDELPQFWNVLKGDMSIVGPRPHMLLHTEQYSKLIDKYMVRHFVKPGITGWSQVTGCRGETKELSDMERRIRGDIFYVEHWNLEFDLFIIYKTVVNVVMGEKEAY
jgi:putative colanic acid biosynthesis UDP-glucose lipid carrier transferase